MCLPTVGQLGSESQCGEHLRHPDVITSAGAFATLGEGWVLASPAVHSWVCRGSWVGRIQAGIIPSSGSPHTSSAAASPPSSSSGSATSVSFTTSRWRSLPGRPCWRALWMLALSRSPGTQSSSEPSTCTITRGMTSR